MSNSKEDTASLPSSGFVARLKYILAESILPLFNLTTYKRLKTTRIAREQNIAQIDQLLLQIEALVRSNAELERSIAQLERLNTQNEQLKFKLTNEFVATYVKNHPREVKQPLADNVAISSIQVDERIQAFQLLIQNSKLPLEVLSVLASIPESHDSVYRNYLRPVFEQRVVGENPQFWDIRMALNALSRVSQPRYYLEIGTRVGWSLAQVLAYTPQTQVYSFDMWIENYGSAENPGPDFVRNAMRKITSPIEPQITFISGDSHDTLAQFFQPERYAPSFQLAAPRPTAFDLITVDGDHNLEGAWMDLTAVLPHIAIGGAIVFDDLDLSLSNSTIETHSKTSYPDFYQPMPEGLQSLRDVWNAIKKLYPNFTYIETGTQSIAVGIGIRFK